MIWISFSQLFVAYWFLSTKLVHKMVEHLGDLLSSDTSWRLLLISSQVFAALSNMSVLSITRFLKYVTSFFTGAPRKIHIYKHYVFGLWCLNCKDQNQIFLRRGTVLKLVYFSIIACWSVLKAEQTCIGFAWQCLEILHDVRPTMGASISVLDTVIGVPLSSLGVVAYNRMPLTSALTKA